MDEKTLADRILWSQQENETKIKRLRKRGRKNKKEEETE